MPIFPGSCALEHTDPRWYMSHLCPRSLPNESDLGTKMTVFYQPLVPFCEAVTHEIQDFLGWYLRVGEDTQPAV